jgi:hypothetical protein
MYMLIETKCGNSGQLRIPQPHIAQSRARLAKRHCQRFIDPNVFRSLLWLSTLSLWSVSCEKSALHFIWRRCTSSMMRNYNSGHAAAEKRDVICIARNYNVCFCALHTHVLDRSISLIHVAESTKTRVRACCNADEALVIKPSSRTTTSVVAAAVIAARCAS